MRIQQFIYIAALILFVGFVTACSSGSQNKSKEIVDNQKMNGAEILQDAKAYADKQCLFKRREISLKNDPNVKDFEIKIQELKAERKKLKNYYLKKYEGMPEERVAFQRAVKAARFDSEYCKNMPREKGK